MAGHAANRKSVTMSIRVPIWLHEQLIAKKSSTEETDSAVLIRAIVAFVAGGSDGG
jgi:hypothetical protein